MQDVLASNKFHLFRTDNTCQLFFSIIWWRTMANFPLAFTIWYNQKIEQSSIGIIIVSRDVLCMLVCTFICHRMPVSVQVGHQVTYQHHSTGIHHKYKQHSSSKIMHQYITIHRGQQWPSGYMYIQYLCICNCNVSYHIMAHNWLLQDFHWITLLSRRLN